MSEGIRCRDLVKHYGAQKALDGVSFDAPMGAITGFVGANGAGKTTAMRVLLGLAEPDAGEATIRGTRYRQIRHPRTQVGAVLDEPGTHPGRSGQSHLTVLTASAGLPSNRVREVLDLVELTDAAARKAGGYSLGMRQRLALAGALLGEPPVLMLDEPTKGLDPPGIRWLRDFLRGLADEGRCVLVSSHHLDELEALADRLVLIDRGRILAEGQTTELLRRDEHRVIARTEAPELLVRLIERNGARARIVDASTVAISGLAADQVGQLAALERLPLHHLADERGDLETLFFELTGARDV